MNRTGPDEMKVLPVSRSKDLFYMEEFKYIITQEEINLLPLGVFNGTIHLFKNQDEAEEYISKLEPLTIIGFDTESRPSFKKGQHFPISLIQIATETDAYLFRIRKTGIPQSLKKILADEKIAKIGVGLQQDLSEMRAKRIECANFIDLEKIAGIHKFKQRGIRALAAFFLGMRISKSAQKSNWARDTLSPAQIRYAATDAWSSLMIYLEMKKKGFLNMPVQNDSENE
jgi:ribonuclease D